METFTIVLALVGLVIIIGSLLSGAEKRGLPLVAAFLLLGAVLGPYGLGLTRIGLESEALRVLAMLALALVLFSDAVTIDAGELRSRWSLVWRLLGPGTIVPAVLIAVAARFILSVSWPAAAILGAALASTDPVLLRSVLRQPALPPMTRIALRIETGMNDVVLLPIVILAMLVIQPGGVHGDRTVSQSLIGLFILGPLLGALIGWIGITLLSSIRRTVGVRRDYESLYALGLAFTAFSAAEAAGGSGFLAAFAAGLMVNARDTELCDCFLEYGEATAEMLLLLTFVALGSSLIWTGFGILDVRTLIFAVLALAARTAVLYPVLASAGVTGRDRRLIASLGARGLSSLLLVLLPVFAGISGAEFLFTVTCLVVVLSVVVHGTAIAVLLRKSGATPAGREAVEPVQPARADEGATDDESVPLLITLDEVKAMARDRSPLVIADSRRNFDEAESRAEKALRLHPDHPAADAAALNLDRRATIAVYCA